VKDNIISTIVICAALYFGVNWAAENPRQIKRFQKQMNHYVGAATHKARTLIN
jgi:uncharacterized membrane protein YciS (DUF1049 family)